MGSVDLIVILVKIPVPFNSHSWGGAGRNWQLIRHVDVTENGARFHFPWIMRNIETSRDRSVRDYQR